MFTPVPIAATPAVERQRKKDFICDMMRELPKDDERMSEEDLRQLDEMRAAHSDAAGNLSPLSMLELRKQGRWRTEEELRRLDETRAAHSKDESESTSTERCNDL